MLTGKHSREDQDPIHLRLGFRILQFSAAMASNVHAVHLYERLGFARIGTIPDGFRMPDGSFEDIVLFYHRMRRPTRPDAAHAPA